jgi:serine/threonine protein kinase
MYERFSDHARKVMQLANQEAQRFNHAYIGTEHLLLALIKEGSGIAAAVLKNFEINPHKIRLEIERIVQSGPDMVTMGKLPQTPRAKKVIEYAIEEARNFNHNYVGTEHLLLGLLCEGEGVAGQVLRHLGLTLETARKEVRRLILPEDKAPKQERQAAQEADPHRSGGESVSSCPAPVRLLRLLHAALPEEEQAPLMEHLETCAGCREALEALAAGQDSWDGVARNLRGDKGPRSTRPFFSSKEGTLDFLDSPAKPGQLGKLAHYEILDVIGRGGMGVVLKALDTTLQRVVAVKVMAPELAVSGTARERFRREAHAAAAVSHDNIVTIHAVDEAKGLPYLVMQYVSGVSLQEKLDREGLLELKEILRIGIQTADGLAAAHAQGLIHRDIKPANILLENGVQRVKITDFGLARAVDDASLTQSGVIAGTPQYMSPEQALGEPQDHRTDLFSLGSVLYTLCTGRPPFRAPNTLAVLRRVAEEPPRRIRQVNPEIPDWLEAIVEKLMEKHPVDRFQSAAEVARLLESHLAHLQKPAHIPQPPPVVPVRKPAKRPKVTFWLLMAAGALCLACCLLPALLTLGYVTTSSDSGPSVTVIESSGPQPREALVPKITLRPDKDDLTCVALSPDGKKLAAGYQDGTILLYELAMQSAQKSSLPKGLLPTICTLAFSPDGKTLFAAGGGNRARNAPGREVVLWDLAEGKEADSYEWPWGLLTCMAVSPNGQWLAVGGQNGVKVWDLSTREECPVPQQDFIRCVAFSYQSTTVAAASQDKVVRFWDPATGNLKGDPLRHADMVQAICFHPDGQTLATGLKNNHVLVWDLRSRKIRSVRGVTPGSWVNSLATSRDGKMLVVGLNNQTADISHHSSGDWTRSSVYDHVEEIREDQGGVIALTPDGKLLSTGHRDGTIRLFVLAE